MEITSSIRSALWSKTVAPLLKWNFATEGTCILDPLSVIVVLASNASKPIGTKLSISNGKLKLHDSSVMQGAVRTIYGDSKTDLKLLHYPIIYACKHSLRRDPISDDMNFLFQRAMKGLDNLKHTYTDDREIRACINTYINIIKSCFETGTGTGPASEFLDMLLRLNMMNVDRDREADPDSTALVPRPRGSDVKSNLFEELHRSWDANKIAIVVGMVRELDEATPFGREHIFVSLDNFMVFIHEKTKQISDSVFEVK
jgi:hypothetical protein